MDAFILRHRDEITGTLSCFDRLIFKGHLPINHTRGMYDLLSRHQILIKDLKPFLLRQSERLKRHAQAVAHCAGRPYHYLTACTRKEAFARRIAQQDGITDGLICVLSMLEPCRSFKVVPGKGCPRLAPAHRKCLALYYYLIDRDYGFMHVRLQTWFPFTIQIYINGHEYLARKMARHDLEYRHVDNAFTWLEHPKRAQRFANGLTRKNWPRILESFARRVNPLLGDLLNGMRHYWVAHQAEYATDVLFRDRKKLRDLYPRLLRHATLSFSAEDVLTFLGRKLHGKFEGEVLNKYKKRQPGARVKHRMKANWIKMYDKHGCVLRVETVINDPGEFKVRRRGHRKGSPVIDWFPMCKGVSNLYRYVEVSLRANRRYLDALRRVEDPRSSYGDLHRMAQSVRINGRSARGFNPASHADVALFRAVLRGEHCLAGFRNADVRKRLFAETRNPQDRRRRSARVTRLLKRLQAHRYVAKIPRSRRWKVTERGANLMSAVVHLHDDDLPQLLQEAA